MSRPLNKLSAVKVSGKLTPGYYSDGGGLYLRVASGGTKSWIFRFALKGRTRDAGLGAYPAVSLVSARGRATENRRLVAAGIDPILARDEDEEAKAKAEASSMNFGQCADAYIKSHEIGWRNEKHRAQWRSTLDTYAKPIMGFIPVDAVDTDDVLRVVEPIWGIKPETASRVRGRIEAVLSWAKAKGLRNGENPALWRGHLDRLLPAKSKVRRVEHHAALPYGQMPEFMKALSAQSSIAAKCLAFVILTAARTGEVLGACWDEIDLENKVWTVPGNRMKAGKIHRVPLSRRAISILKEMKAVRRNEFIFPGMKEGKPLSQMALLMTMRRIEYGHVTVHGFRSSFRDWAAEKTTFPREAAEMALAHAIPDAVEAAYRRGEMLEKRRKLMEDWSSQCAI